MVTTHFFQFQFHKPSRINSPPPPPLPLPLPQTNYPNFLARRNNNGRRRCTGSGDREVRQGGSRWYSDDTIGSKRFDFDLDDDDNGDFGFRSDTKKRNWWSGNDEEEEEDDEDDDGFGVLEDSINGIAWITKIIKAFGWMVPAIMISMIVGTGPNAFFMALALPLAQTAFSLVIDTFSGTTKNNTRYKPRTKGRRRRRPFARAASNIKENERTAGNEGSFKKGERSSSKFGGWDELDEQERTDQSRSTKEKSQPKKGKLSRMVRKQEKPLVLRLLIAVFPFLGSWTRFL